MLNSGRSESPILNKQRINFLLSANIVSTLLSPISFWSNMVAPLGMLRWLAKLLAPGGRLFFTVFNPRAKMGDFWVRIPVHQDSISSFIRAGKDWFLLLLITPRDVLRIVYLLSTDAGRRPTAVSASYDDYFHGDIISDVNDFLGHSTFWAKTINFLEKYQSRYYRFPVAADDADFHRTPFLRRLYQATSCLLIQGKFIYGRNNPDMVKISHAEYPHSLLGIYPGLNSDQVSFGLPDSDSWMPSDIQLFSAAKANLCGYYLMDYWNPARKYS